MTSSSSARALVAACMDHVALEGVSGLSVASLFAAVEPANDLQLRRHVWRLLRSSCGPLLFFRAAKASAAGGRKKRKRPLPGDSAEDSVVVKREALESVGHYGTAANAMLSDQEVAQMAYEDVVADGDNAGQLTAVACEELRHRALNIPVRAIAADLGEEHLRILEAIGRARVHGVTITALSEMVGGTVKRLHNYLDTLISCGLVVKRIMIVAKPTMRRLNIVHLPRFAMDFTPKMLSDSAEFESDDQSKKILCAAVEMYLKKLPTCSSVLADLGRDLGLHKRQLEALRSYILQETKIDGNFPLELFQAVLQPSKRASLEPMTLNCVRYKQPSANGLTGKRKLYRRGIVPELGLLEQIYGIIEHSAAQGTTILDLRDQITLPGNKLPYKLVSLLASAYGLKAESIILGKNKAFRLYLDSVTPAIMDEDHAKLTDVTDSIEEPSSPPTEITEAASGTFGGLKTDRCYSVRTLKGALGTAELDGTNSRRQRHILERLHREKIISVSSLRASVFRMEKQHAEKCALLNASSTANARNSPPAPVGLVDTRSIYRIATELELAKKLLLLQLPLPAQNVSTKFRALRCVVSPGYEKNDTFIQSYVRNYCRDERLRRIHQNAENGEVVRFQKLENDADEIRELSKLHGSARKRRRTSAKRSNSKIATAKEQNYESNGFPEVKHGDYNNVDDGDLHGPGSPPPREVSYRIRRFVSQQQSGIHHMQYKKLGFAYGVMYRCKVLHRFLWNSLHQKKSSDLDGVSINDLADDDGSDARYKMSSGNTGIVADVQDDDQMVPKGIVFSRESVLHSMPVYLYIQVFSGGAILTDSEFAIMEEAIANKCTFDEIPAEIREKVWSHETQRTSKVLGTLADLGLVAPHKIGMSSLVKILRAGYTDGRDGVLSQALKDNALGGLFRFNKQVRIMLNDDFSENNSTSLPTDVQDDTGRHSVNTLDSLRVVGFTEKSYTFGDSLPLQFALQSEREVDRYWEALECLCLEQMAMEVTNPRKNEPSVREVPKPVRTRARRMLRILAWIPKSRRPAAKQKRESGDNDTQLTISGIVSTNFRPRKKRRQLQNDRNTNGGTALAGNTGTARGKSRKALSCTATTDDGGRESAKPLSWTATDEQLLVQYFIDNCRSRWKITIPQSLQRDKEQVAFRNHTLSRSGFGLVAIARKLGKRNIDVKKRLKEKLLEPVVKLLFENAKREAQLADNPGGTFDEEVAIQGSARLTSLFRRALMIIVSPREEYHPLVAEELISYWNAHEVRLVWRYLWLKNWIVRASEKERGRGYCTTQRLQDALKVTTLSYPLHLFQQAAEQESMVNSTLEEITSERHVAKHRSASIDGIYNTDQVFEDNFPTNATPGQCALELGYQVLGTCSLTAHHSAVLKNHTSEESSRAARLASTATKRENLRLLSYKSLRGGSGFASHLANKVNATKPSDLIDCWRVETKMHAMTVEDAELVHECEAFSNAKSDDNGGLGAIAFRSFRHGMDFEKELGEEVVCLVRESGEDGLTLPLLMEKLHAAPNTDVHGTSLVRVTRCLNTLIDEGVVLCVNAYYDQRYILKEHGDGWLLRPFSLVPSAGSASTLQVVFEGEKDTLSYPWLKMDGGTNCKFLFAIQRKLLALILQNPGITEDLAYAKLDKLLSLQDTREAMSLLVDEGLVYTRAAATADTKTVPVSLFGSQNPSVPRVMKLVGNVLSYDRSSFTIHYFPHVECIQRFGSIVQDYQNEVSEFQCD